MHSLPRLVDCGPSVVHEGQRDGGDELDHPGRGWNPSGQEDQHEEEHAGKGNEQKLIRKYTYNQQMFNRKYSYNQTETALSR